MTLYVKKRIPIEAVKPGTISNSELRKFTNNLIILEDPEDDGDTGYYAVYDRLHDTWVQFRPGDWIAKGVKGEFYPIKASVFEETYEEYYESGEVVDSNRVHVIPVKDTIDHTDRLSCNCNPDMTEDGVIVHHAADGRE